MPKTKKLCCSFNCHFLWLIFYFFCLFGRYIDRCILTMYSEYFWRNPVHPVDMGRWYGWSDLWLSHRILLLLCGNFFEYCFTFLSFRQTFAILQDIEQSIDISKSNSNTTLIKMY